MIIRLAGQHVAVRFDAHAVECGGAAFYAEVVGGGVKLTVLGGCVPDQLLSTGGGFLGGNIEDGLQFTFVQARANGQALTREDEGVESDGGDSVVGEKIQCGGNGVDVGAQHGGVGHHVEFCGEDVVEAGDGLFEGAFGPHHFIVNFRHAGFDGDLDVVEAGIDKLLDVVHVDQAARVRIQPCDLAVLFCVLNQLW